MKGDEACSICCIWHAYIRHTASESGHDFRYPKAINFQLGADKDKLRKIGTTSCSFEEWIATLSLSVWVSAVVRTKVFSIIPCVYWRSARLGQMRGTQLLSLEIFILGPGVQQVLSFCLPFKSKPAPRNATVGVAGGPVSGVQPISTPHPVISRPPIG